MIALLAAILLPQDLLERDRALRRALPPAPDFASLKPMRAEAGFEARADFACGSFDAKASFRSLFDRNVREEFLQGALSALQSELAGSALVLACYASPTVCDAIKHYRVSANGMLGMEFDACRTIESAAGDFRQQAAARAAKDCLEAKARSGVPLDRARQACASAAELRGFDGKPTAELDLLKDLKLDGALVPGLTLGAAGFKAEARGTALVEAYEARRTASEEAWRAALAAPDGAVDGLTRAELASMAAMEPGTREAALRSVAAAQAYAATVDAAQSAERSLESAELLAAPELREELERRRRQLRNEVSRLAERFEAERRVSAALEAVRAAAEAETSEKAGARLAARRALDGKAAALDAAQPWGCEIRKGDGRGKVR